jgi:hypothetical protein
MTASRDRKRAAKILGITMQAQLRALREASDQEAITRASINLSKTFLDNAEFITYVLKDFGGMQVVPPTRRTENAAMEKRSH